MNEQDKTIDELIADSKIDQVKAKFANQDDKATKALDQWNVAEHEIMKRADKKLESGTIVESWNLPISYQKKIVQSAVAFLFGKPIRLKRESGEDTEEVFQMLLELRKDMRMPAKDQLNARLVKSETISAKLFVPYRDADADKNDLTKKNRVKCILLAKSLGDVIYTRFDEYNVLQAAARGYKTKDGNKDVEHFDIYRPDYNYYCTKINGSWQVVPELNVIGKIWLVIYQQDEAEWSDVQKLIHRREVLTSRRADNNDRSGDPILVLEGDVESLPDAKTVGKVVQLGVGGKASYLVPQMSVDMVKNEKEDLKELIHYLTDTPDLSMEKMTSMGLTSGKAIEMAFFGALLKAMGSHGYYEEMIDRENSILKAFIGKVIDTGKEKAAKKLEVSIEFGNPLPDNVDDMIDMLSTATGGKPIMSQETAVARNPLVNDAEEEMKRIGKEKISVDLDKID